MKRVVTRAVLPLALACTPALAQVTLTGAVEFSSSTTGSAYSGQIWNTLGGDRYDDLWLAQNADGTLPVNGPSDDLAGINIPLTAGNTYKLYTFGQPNTGSR